MQYIVNEQGMVQIPLEDWKNMQMRYKKLHQKVRVMTGIQQGLKEVHDSIALGKPLQKLDDFLSELQKE
ncbi:hypothetical protein ACS5NO_29675 [Larkinella sp. GY13]|uniref:hypothetical protein n=1 Tax=Larkinella sp. GY13 TaxID=3453720 RepID=UPI003EEFBAE3